MRAQRRLVPITTKTRGRELPVSVDPVYNVGDYGVNLCLLFPPNLDGNANPSNHNRKLLEPYQVSYGATLFQILAAGGAISTFDETFEYSIDYPCFLLSVNPYILARLVVGAGNTVTLQSRLVISIQGGTTLVDETLEVTGLTANGDIAFMHVTKGYNELLAQFSRILVRTVITATRTAGASNTQSGLTQNAAGGSRSSVVMHLLPALSHADTVYGGIKAR